MSFHVFAPNQIKAMLNLRFFSSMNEKTPYMSENNFFQ